MLKFGRKISSIRSEPKKSETYISAGLGLETNVSKLLKNVCT